MSLRLSVACILFAGTAVSLYSIFQTLGVIFGDAKIVSGHLVKKSDKVLHLPNRVSKDFASRFENGSCSTFNFQNTRFYQFNQSCLDSSTKLFTSAGQCSDTVQLVKFQVFPLPPPEDVAVVFSGKGLIIDCWESSGNPSHSFMGLTQATHLMDWVKATQDRTIQWVITRGCSMHTATSITSAIQMSIDAVIFSDSLLSHRRVPLWDLPLDSSKIICFESAIFAQQYGVFPPLHWRKLILRNMNLLLGFVPSPNITCRSIMIGIYFRSGSSNTNQLRRICNSHVIIERMGEVMGNKSSTIEFSTNSSMSLLSQIHAFDQFDIIFGPHGSHWALSWFAERPRAIIEIQAVLLSFDLHAVISSKGKGFHFFVSAGHSFQRNDCNGVNQELSDAAKPMCAKENFDGTSLLCKISTSCGILPCSSNRPEDKKFLQSLKCQSTKVNISALLNHLESVLQTLTLPHCVSRESGQIVSAR
jgi:hypothetical protein